MGAGWLDRRGEVFGCGMATIALGDGVVGIPEIVEALERIGFDGYTTLEVAGEENVKRSAARLKAWSCRAAGAEAFGFGCLE